MGRPFPGQHRAEVFRVEPFLGGKASQGAQRRIDVDQFHQRVGRPSPRNARARRDEGHAQGRLVGHGLGVQAMVAQHLAVVAGKDDDGVTGHAPSFDRLDDPSHLVVDQFDGRAILSARNGDFVVGEVAPAGVDPVRTAFTRAAHGRRHPRVPVPVGVCLGRIEGIVGTHEADEEVPGVIAGHGVDPFGGAAADVGVLEGLRGQHRVVGRVPDPAPRFPGRVVRPEAIEKPLLLQPEPVGTPGMVRHARVHLALALHGMGESPPEHPGPVAVAAVVGVRLGQVQFPHAPHPVLRVPQPGVIGRDMPRQVAVVVQASQPRGLEPAGQADAGGRADRGVGDALGEADPALRQPVEIRRAHERRSRGRQVIVAVLVVHDEEEIGASVAGHGFVSLMWWLVLMAGLTRPMGARTR